MSEHEPHIESQPKENDSRIEDIDLAYDMARVGNGIEMSIKNGRKRRDTALAEIGLNGSVNEAEIYEPWMEEDPDVARQYIADTLQDDIDEERARVDSLYKAMAESETKRRDIKYIYGVHDK
jgi:hypothetical protein